MQFVRTARPTQTSIEVADVKANERIRHNAEDVLIERHIKAAELSIEKATNRAIMRQTFTLTVSPMQPALSLYYPPMEGSVGLLSAGYSLPGDAPFQFDVETLPVTIVDQLPKVWFPGVRRAIKGWGIVSYETGSVTPDDVPADIQQAVLLLASYYYKAREAATSDERIHTEEKRIPYGVEHLIGPYRIHNIQTPYYEANVP